MQAIFKNGPLMGSKREIESPAPNTLTVKGYIYSLIRRGRMAEYEIKKGG
jgi:hypothetical protein